MSYCQIGDSPTVYYKFKGQPNYAKVTFEKMAPIDIDIENLSNSSGGDSGGDSLNNPCYPAGIPGLGTQCTLIYSSWQDWWASDPSAIGEGSSTGASGGGHLPEPTTGYLDAGYNYGDDGWTYRYSYRPTNTQQTDEDGTRYKYFFVVEASKSIPFNGQPPTELPSPYEAVGDARSWGFISDSCGWVGNFNCSMSPPPPPSSPSSPSSPDSKAQVKLKVFFDSKLIWSKAGEPPLDYEVSCSKEECPPGMCKLNNAQGFCCIKSDELKEPINIIKSILRHQNG